MVKKCKDCKSRAAEESGRCFYCAEELAYLLADAAMEFGGDPVKFAKSAWI